MIKTNKMIVGLITLICVFITINTASAVPPKVNLLPSDYSTGVTYEQAIKESKPMVIKFYVDWCGYCRKFAPTFNSIRNNYQDKFTFVLVNCDDEKYADLMRDFGITGYPSVYIVDPANDNRILLPIAFYNSPKRLSKELDRFIKIYGKPSNDKDK